MPISNESKFGLWTLEIQICRRKLDPPLGPLALHGFHRHMGAPRDVVGPEDRPGATTETHGVPNAPTGVYWDPWVSIWGPMGPTGSHLAPWGPGANVHFPSGLVFVKRRVHCIWLMRSGRLLTFNKETMHIICV